MLDRSKRPELSGFKGLRFDFPQYVKLSNGVKLYVLNNGDQDVNRLEVICRGGSFDETKPLQAFALAAMLVHGSSEYTSNDVAEILDFNGSYMNAVNHDNYTHVTLNSLNKNFENVLPVFRSVVKSPSIPEREFDVLKAQMKSAYRTARMKVKYLAQNEAYRLYYGDAHPLAHNVSDEDVDTLCAEDVRDFHKKFYRPENQVLVLSGRVGEREISLVEKFFGKDEVNCAECELKTFDRVPSAVRKSEVNRDGALQSSVFMIQEAIARSHPDYVKLRILVTALGGYFGSRLMQNIREEKGYTYGISAMLMGRRDNASIVINSECDTSYTYCLIDEVKNEILKLQDEPIGLEELEIVKNSMLSDLAKTLDSPFSMAGCISSNLFYGTGEDYFNRQVRDIENITSEELLRVAKKYLNVDNFYVAVAGDEKQLKLYSK